MAVAVASACDPDGNPLYQVTGVDQPTSQGRDRVDALRCGFFPFPTADTSLSSALEFAHETGNLTATTDESVYNTADVVVIDVALEISFLDKEPQLQTGSFEQAVRSVGQRIPEGALMLVETTVPPGTCEKVVAPALRDELFRRGMSEHAVYLAHSFERVMPGDHYLDSITSFWRAYAGLTPEAATVCQDFLSSIIDVERFPLMRLSSMTASETAKVMENTYRAVNIAFIDEWTKYAEAVGVDLYEVIDAIRVRPTHSNIRFPGLGVGGYCLTKDPAIAAAGAQQLHDLAGLNFPFSQLAMKVNHEMPLHTADRLISLLGENINKKSILVLGVSYHHDIGDTRYSPTETLVRTWGEGGAIVTCYAPFVRYWGEMKRSLPADLPDPRGFDAIVIAVAHQAFSSMDILEWLDGARPTILDTANVVNIIIRHRCRKAGIQIESVGRSDGL